MNYQKGDCFGPPPPLALVVLSVALVLAALAVRMWRQGFVLHAAFALFAPPGLLGAVFWELVLTGKLQLVFLAGCLVHEHMRTELTPARIRLRARAVPVHGRENSAPYGPSA